jgi:hypothetical protein
MLGKIVKALKKTEVGCASQTEPPLLVMAMSALPPESGHWLVYDYTSMIRKKPVHPRSGWMPVFRRDHAAIKMQ